METEDFRRWVCDACGYIYDEAKGDPDSGLAPGTRYEQIPEDWQCPLCGLRKSDLRPLPEMAPAAPRASAARFGKKTAAKSKGGEDYLVIIGAGIGAAGGGSEPATRRWIGPAMLPQAGANMGMALVATGLFPEHRQLLLSVIISTTVLFELVGPVITRLALRRMAPA